VLIRRRGRMRMQENQIVGVFYIDIKDYVGSTSLVCERCS
jgi:hypothetical protein